MNPLVWPWTMTILSQPSATKTPAAKQNCCASIESFLKTRLNAIPSLIPSEDMASWQPIATSPSKMLSICAAFSAGTTAVVVVIGLIADLLLDLADGQRAIGIDPGKVGLPRPQRASQPFSRYDRQPLE